MNESQPVHHSAHTIDASPTEVWEALTDDDGVDAWFGPDSHLEPEEDGHLDVNDEATGTRRVGVVHRAEPGRRLAFTWWPEPDDADRTSTTRVDIELVPSGTGCRVLVTERPAPGSLQCITATTATPGLTTRIAWQTRIRELAKGTSPVRPGAHRG